MFLYTDKYCLMHYVTGKLLSRTQKIAYNLLHKVGQKGEGGIKQGDRVSVILLLKQALNKEIG